MILAGCLWSGRARRQAMANRPRSAPPPRLRPLGSAAEETFALKTASSRGAWPGPSTVGWTRQPRQVPLQVRDRATNRLVYSRGFASIYTASGKAPTRQKTCAAPSTSRCDSHAESPVQVILKKRDRALAFREVFSLLVDPKTPPSTARDPPRASRWWAVQESGPPRDKVDLLLLGDATPRRDGEWHQDARRLAEMLFAESPFKERRSYFNVWALDHAGRGERRRALLGRRAPPLPDSRQLRRFGSERYVLTFDTAGGARSRRPLLRVRGDRRERPQVRGGASTTSSPPWPPTNAFNH